jgi:hypothetical protein
MPDRRLHDETLPIGLSDERNRHATLGGSVYAQTHPHRNRRPDVGGTGRRRADEPHRRDARPGCHWFYMGGGPNNRKFVKTVTRTGPVRLVNLDEVALIIKGPGGTRHEKVGATLTLRAKGIYKITMVKQAPDDNHLKLTIK